MHSRNEVGDTTVIYYTATVLNASSYYPFGWNMPGRSYQGSLEYRHRFNGMEKDNDATNSAYDFGARMYNSQIGRWWSVDQMISKYPSFSTYGFAGNSPIFLLDPNGKWIARFNSDKTGIEFVAEENDDLTTLSLQLGIDSKDLLKTYPDFETKVWCADDVETFIKLEPVSAINNAINNPDINLCNCANFAMNVNGELTNNAWDKNLGSIMISSC